jgi:hypothetical protein
LRDGGDSRTAKTDRPTTTTIRRPTNYRHHDVRNWCSSQRRTGKQMVFLFERHSCGRSLPTFASMASHAHPREGDKCAALPHTPSVAHHKTPSAARRRGHRTTSTLTAITAPQPNKTRSAVVECCKTTQARGGPRFKHGNHHMPSIFVALSSRRCGISCDTPHKT